VQREFHHGTFVGPEALNSRFGLILPRVKTFGSCSIAREEWADGFPGLRIETAGHPAFQTAANCLAIARHGPTEATVPTAAKPGCLPFQCGKQDPNKISLLRQLRLSDADYLLHDSSNSLDLPW
jgi:hypothetical protein